MIQNGFKNSLKKGVLNQQVVYALAKNLSLRKQISRRKRNLSPNAKNRYFAMLFLDEKKDESDVPSHVKE